MKTRRLLTIIFFMFLLGNLFCYYALPLNYYFLPFWGKVNINPTTTLVILTFIIAFYIVLKYIPAANQHCIQQKSMIFSLLTLPTITFFQVEGICERYTVSKQQQFTLYNFTRISESSPIVRYILSDIKHEINYLSSIKPDAKPISVNVCIFSSEIAMREGTMLNDDISMVYYDSFKNTIYIWITEWHRSLRHELVHCFQRHSISFGIIGILYERLNYFLNSLPSESEAYFLAPFSGFLEFTVSDFIQASDTNSSTIHSLINLHTFPPQLLNDNSNLSNESLLAAYIISTYRYNNKLKYQDDNRTIPSNNPLKYISADTLSVSYIRYYFASYFPMNHKESKYPFMPLRSFTRDIKQFSKQQTDSIITFNRKMRVTLEHKIEWENFSATLGNSQTDECWKIFQYVQDCLSNDIYDESDLKNLSQTLFQRYIYALDKNYTALSAYIYLRLIECNILLGSEFPKLSEKCLKEYNRSYLDYIDYLAQKNSTIL
jgi:hypothetical protein